MNAFFMTTMFPDAISVGNRHPGGGRLPGASEPEHHPHQ
jgi:hypothetical protein